MQRFRDRLAEKLISRGELKFFTHLLGRFRRKAQSVLSEGLVEGQNPNRVALGLAGRFDANTGKREGSLITLGDAELAQIAEFRRYVESSDSKYFDFDLRDKRFDRGVRSAIARGTTLDSDKVDNIVERFKSKLVMHAAQTIARTEMMTAMHRSEWLSIREALETGDLPESAVEKVWDSAGDDKVRPSHKALDGQRVAFNQPFVSPIAGALMMYPGDATLGAGKDEISACRCRVRYEVDWAMRSGSE